MASNHPIDQLFREKTGNASMEPSADAWNQIQGQLVKTPTKKTWMLKIAAGVALICVSSFVVWNYTQSKPGQMMAENDGIDITNPAPALVDMLVIPERSIRTVDDQPQKEVLVLAEVPVPQETQTVSMEKVTIKEWTDVSLITDVQITQMDFVLPPVNFQQLNDNSIQIKYFTNATLDEGAASKVKLAKIIDYARTTNPIDWVGDLRNKKDELIDNVLSLD